MVTEWEHPMSFSEDVAQRVLVSCGRHCCLCHKFCGTRIELHHIQAVGDRGEDTFENCIPLCFDCHAEVKSYNPRHPKGRKYSEAELEEHRNRWYTKVQDSGGTIVQPEYLDLDRTVFMRIRGLLPSSGVIAFLRHHHYGEPCLSAEHHGLWEFCRECDLPEFEFIDTDLEGLRVELKQNTLEFLEVAGRELFRVETTGNERYVAVPAEWKDSDWKRYDKAVATLNEFANDVIAAYDSLIRLGRRKLAV